MKIKDVLWRVCTKSLIDYTQHGLCIINSEEPLPLDMAVLDVQATNLVLVKKGKSRGTARIPNSSRQKSRLGMSTKKQARLPSLHALMIVDAYNRNRNRLCSVPYQIPSRRGIPVMTKAMKRSRLTRVKLSSPTLSGATPWRSGTRHGRLSPFPSLGLRLIFYLRSDTR